MRIRSMRTSGTQVSNQPGQPLQPFSLRKRPIAFSSKRLERLSVMAIRFLMWEEAYIIPQNPQPLDPERPTRMKTLLDWLSKDLFCNGLFLIVVLDIVVTGIVKIVHALTGYYPEELERKDD